MSSGNLSRARARVVARLIANFEPISALLYLISSHLTSPNDILKHAWSNGE